MPPEGDMREPYPGVGVRALEFPRWFVCEGCHRLARAVDQFENKGHNRDWQGVRGLWAIYGPEFSQPDGRGSLS